MLCQRLQVERLRADGRELLQQSALAAARCAADDAEGKTRGKRRQIRDHVPSIGAVAALELLWTPSDTRQNMCHRRASIAAAPAVDQWLPRLRLVRKLGLQMARNVSRHIHGTTSACLERGLLPIHC